MKITIQHYDETASLEVPDGNPLDDFRDVLIRILHVMWLPEQVAEIMRVKDWDEGFSAGKEEGFDKGHAEGFAESEKCLPTPEIKELLKDKERLDWLLHEDNEMGCVVIRDWGKDRQCYAERTLMTRSELDQAMEEAQ